MSRHKSLPNNSNAADGRKPLVLSLRLSAAADLSRYAAHGIDGAIFSFSGYWQDVQGWQGQELAFSSEHSVQYGF